MNLARFRALMRVVAGQARRAVRRLLSVHGVPVTPAQRLTLAKALHPHLVRARAQAYQAGAASLVAQAKAARVTVPPAPPRLYPVAALVTVLENVTRVDDPGPRSSATVTVDPHLEGTERPRPRVTVTETGMARDADRPRVRVDTAADAGVDSPPPRASVTAAAADQNPGAGRAKVSVRVMDTVTRHTRPVTVEITDTNRRDPAVVKVVAAKLEATVERHVRAAARDVVTDSVEQVNTERRRSIGDEAHAQVADQIAGLDAARERARQAAAERNAGAVERNQIAIDERNARLGAPPTFRPPRPAPAEPQGEKIGWARILTGAENCGFCAMLASRGPVYESKHTATHVGASLNAYHDNCDCEAVLVVEGRAWPGREQYDALEQLWIASTVGTSGNESIKAFTRAWNGAVTDGQADQYLVRTANEGDAA